MGIGQLLKVFQKLSIQRMLQNVKDDIDRKKTAGFYVRYSYDDSLPFFKSFSVKDFMESFSNEMTV